MTAEVALKELIGGGSRLFLVGVLLNVLARFTQLIPCRCAAPLWQDE